MNFALESVILLLVISAGLFTLGFLLNSFSRKMRETFSGATNHNTFVYLFFPGIVIHEISHMLAALAFLYEIVDFKLIDFKGKSGSHGHVTSRPRNLFNFLYIPQLWQSMGHLFIGVAPLVVGPGLMLLWFYYFVPGGRGFINDPSLQTFPLFTLHLCVWSYICFATISNIELSDADLSGTWKGFGFVVLSVFVFALALAFLKPQLITNGFLHNYWAHMGLGKVHLKIVRPLIK